MRNLNFGTFRRIGDIWQENDIAKFLGRVDLNYVEVFFIQLKIPVIFTVEIYHVIS